MTLLVQLLDSSSTGGRFSGIISRTYRVIVELLLLKSEQIVSISEILLTERSVFVQAERHKKSQDILKL